MIFCLFWNPKFKKSKFCPKMQFGAKLQFLRKMRLSRKMHFLRKIVDSWENSIFLIKKRWSRVTFARGSRKIRKITDFLVFNSKNAISPQNAKFHPKMHFWRKVHPWRAPRSKPSLDHGIWPILEPEITKMCWMWRILTFLHQNPESRLHVMKNPWNHQKPSRNALFLRFPGPPDLKSVKSVMSGELGFPDASLREGAEPNLCREAGCAPPTPI